MEKEVIKGLAKTIIDGIKDAQMQLDYAEEAREHGECEIAHRHLNEAHERLNGVKEWYEFAEAKMGKHHDGDMAYHAMEEHYRDWARKIRERIAEF